MFRSEDGLSPRQVIAKGVVVTVSKGVLVYLLSLRDSVAIESVV